MGAACSTVVGAVHQPTGLRMKAQAYEMVKPGFDQSLPLRDLFDESKTPQFEFIRKPYVGKIMFSSSPIDPLWNNAKTQTVFHHGDEIHARATWARALRNLPLARHRTTGAPMYGPEKLVRGRDDFHCLHFYLFMYVDGVKIQGSFKDGALCHQELLGPNTNWEDHKIDASTTSDWWAFNQTMKLAVCAPPDSDSTGDDWFGKHVGAVSRALAKLPPGDHTFKVDMCFEMEAYRETILDMATRSWGLQHPSNGWPLDNTLMSSPIASGEFNFQVRAGDQAVVVSALPVRCPDVSEDDAIAVEKFCMKILKENRHGHDFSKETTLSATVIREWSQSEPCQRSGEGNLAYEKRRERERCDSIDVRVVWYRNPLNGWEEESVVLFDLCFNFKDRDNLQTFDHISIGGLRGDISADDVPEEVWAAAGVSRCPEALRKK
eukprot:GILK01009001.1.p1 GENE.GILK01009001.1~~GILK01009001.1.p1  ORF type:complete len:453 (+),score=71.49 GILK01009001.1:58-1359(+)